MKSKLMLVFVLILLVAQIVSTQEPSVISSNIISPGISNQDMLSKVKDQYNVGEQISFTIPIRNSGTSVVQGIFADGHISKQFNINGNPALITQRGYTAEIRPSNFLSLGGTGEVVFNLPVRGVSGDAVFSFALYNADRTLLLQFAKNINIIGSVEADLKVTGITPPEDRTYGPGDTIQSSVTIRNDGSAAVTFDGKRVAHMPSYPCRHFDEFFKGNACSFSGDNILNPGETDTLQCQLNIDSFDTGRSITNKFRFGSVNNYISANANSLNLESYTRYKMDVPGYCLKYVAPTSIQPGHDTEIEYNIQIEPGYTAVSGLRYELLIGVKDASGAISWTLAEEWSEAGSDGKKTHKINPNNLPSKTAGTYPIRLGVFQGDVLLDQADGEIKVFNNIYVCKANSFDSSSNNPDEWHCGSGENDQWCKILGSSESSASCTANVSCSDAGAKDYYVFTCLSKGTGNSCSLYDHGRFNAQPAPNEICGDNIDNDCNGKTDSEDISCIDIGQFSAEFIDPTPLDTAIFSQGHDIRIAVRSNMDSRSAALTLINERNEETKSNLTKQNERNFNSIITPKLPAGFFRFNAEAEDSFGRKANTETRSVNIVNCNPGNSCSNIRVCSSANSCQNIGVTCDSQGVCGFTGVCNNDGICQQNEGCGCSDCLKNTCDLASIQWVNNEGAAVSQAVEGDEIFLNAEGNSCECETVTLSIFEEDESEDRTGNDFIRDLSSIFQRNNHFSNAKWQVQYVADRSGDPEYIFNAEAGTSNDRMGPSSILSVTRPVETCQERGGTCYANANQCQGGAKLGATDCNNCFTGCECIDNDNDGYCSDEDCNDNNPAVFENCEGFCNLNQACEQNLGESCSCADCQSSQCELESAAWVNFEGNALSSAVEHDTVYLQATGNDNCMCETVSFNIFEDDILTPDDPVPPSLSASFNSDNIAMVPWDVRYVSDGIGNPEYKFIANTLASESTAESNLLGVSRPSLSCEQREGICFNNINECRGDNPVRLGAEDCEACFTNCECIDNDNDDFCSYEDCDDNNNEIHEGCAVPGDNIPPVINFIAPTPNNGARINTATTTIKVRVDDQSGIASVTLNFNGQSIDMANENTNIYTALVNELTDGAYDYAVSAADTADNTGQSLERRLIVNRNSPAILGAFLDSLAISPQNTAIKIGSSQQYTVTATYTDRRSEDATSNAQCISNDTSMATVSSCRATGIAAGRVFINATFTDIAFKSASAGLNIEPHECTAGELRSCLSDDPTFGYHQECTSNGEWGECRPDYTLSIRPLQNQLSCINGEKINCPRQFGVCQGSTQACRDGIYQGCNYADIQSYSPNEICGDFLDNDCDGSIDEGCPCSGSQSRSNFCGSDIGICTRGSQKCENGAWSECDFSSAIKPMPEYLKDNLDNDCDGSVDEGFDCGFTEPLGASRSCGFTEGVCHEGIQECSNETFLGVNAWGICSGIILPSLELCDGIDNDCNRAIDEGCSCLAGSSRSCGNSMGACNFGTQECTQGSWSLCTGGTTASLGDICSDNIDNNCDGSVNEGCPCEGNLTGRPCEKQLGVCAGINQTCLNSAWQACDYTSFSSAYEEEERSCSDSIDNDCDGKADGDDENCVILTSEDEVLPKGNCFDKVKNQDEEGVDCGGACKSCTERREQCDEGRITSQCICGGRSYSSGYCCESTFSLRSCAVPEEKNKDSDSDGLPDEEETAKGTNPLSDDTDNDGIPDNKDPFPLCNENGVCDSTGDYPETVDSCAQDCKLEKSRLSRIIVPGIIVMLFILIVVYYYAKSKVTGKKGSELIKSMPVINRYFSPKKEEDKVKKAFSEFNEKTKEHKNVKDLQDYIKRSLELGKDKKSIRKSASRAGWMDKEISDAFWENRNVKKK